MKVVVTVTVDGYDYLALMCDYNLSEEWKYLPRPSQGH